MIKYNSNVVPMLKRQVGISRLMVLGGMYARENKLQPKDIRNYLV